MELRRIILNLEQLSLPSEEMRADLDKSIGNWMKVLGAVTAEEITPYMHVLAFHILPTIHSHHSVQVFSNLAIEAAHSLNKKASKRSCGGRHDAQLQARNGGNGSGQVLAILNNVANVQKAKELILERERDTP
jgi:hypothetical protein